MRNQFLAVPALAALALAACSNKSDEGEPPVAASDAAATPVVDASAEPTAPASSAVAAIPQAIQGRWGLVPADCTSTRGDAKGLVEIDDTTMKFYESLARLGRVREVDDDSLDATFAFTGEGQSWTLDVSLEAEDDGKVLIRKDTGKDAMPGPLRYTRC